MYRHNVLSMEDSAGKQQVKNVKIKMYLLILNVRGSKNK